MGDSAVGKSSVVLRFVSNSFEPNKEPTIGAAFLTQKCRLEDKVIKFEMCVVVGRAKSADESAGTPQARSGSPRSRLCVRLRCMLSIR